MLDPSRMTVERLLPQDTGLVSEGDQIQARPIPTGQNFAGYRRWIRARLL